jgi:hypothetical protein
VRAELLRGARHWLACLQRRDAMPEYVVEIARDRVDELERGDAVTLEAWRIADALRLVGAAGAEVRAVEDRGGMWTVESDGSLKAASAARRLQ